MKKNITLDFLNKHKLLDEVISKMIRKQLFNITDYYRNNSYSCILRSNSYNYILDRLIIDNKVLIFQSEETNKIYNNLLKFEFITGMDQKEIDDYFKEIKDKLDLKKNIGLIGLELNKEKYIQQYIDKENLNTIITNLLKTECRFINNIEKDINKLNTELEVRKKTISKYKEIIKELE